MRAARTAPRRSYPVRPIRLARRFALYATVLAVCASLLFPVYWMFVTSLRPTRYTITYPPAFLPEEIRWEAYAELFQTIPIATWLRNTTLVSVGVTALCLALSIVGAYALSSFEWRGKSLFGFSLLGAQMLPEALVVIPVFVIFRQLGLIDTLQGLILADTAFILPVTVWLLKGFFDGWNEYLFASTFITTAGLRPATVGLASFIGELATPVELVFAATAIFTVPPMVFYFLMQRYIVSGLTGGALKG